MRCIGPFLMVRVVILGGKADHTHGIVGCDQPHALVGQDLPVVGVIVVRSACTDGPGGEGALLEIGCGALCIIKIGVVVAALIVLEIQLLQRAVSPLAHVGAGWIARLADIAGGIGRVGKSRNFIFEKAKRKTASQCDTVFWRRRRDLNSRAGYPAYTLSRGASSANLSTSPHTRGRPSQKPARFIIPYFYGFVKGFS